jgi:NADH dehydrogenase/NADH oxidase (H2O2-forming)
VAGLAAPESVIIPDKKLEEAGINVCIDEATCIDTEFKRVTLSDGSDMKYDKLFIGTGSRAFTPAIEGRELNGVMILRGLPDAVKIKGFLGKETTKKLVFIGAGFITMELASLIVSVNPDKYDVTVVEHLDHPLPLILDKDMAEPVREYIEEKGIKIITGDRLEKINGVDGHVSSVELTSGTNYDANLVFLNVGTKPNVELARDIGLDIEPFGIKVNEYQETSNPDILAGGDCVEQKNFITGKPDPGCLRGQAVMQGRLAAKRLAGFDISFPGVLNAGGCQLFDLNITSTGFTEEAATKEGFKTVCSVVDSRDKHGMIPGMKPWRIKLVFECETEKLIGAQIVSYSEAPSREIDAISAFILGEKTISDLTTFMSACSPDISSEPSMEPISIAAEQALMKIRSL